MVGMIRETHAQRSYLVKETDHGYILECVQGKYKGKPFYWNLPKLSWGKDEGYANTTQNDGRFAYIPTYWGRSLLVPSIRA